MQKLAASAAIAVFLSGCAGFEPITEAERTFDVVHEVPGVPKDKMFASTKIWIAENFRSAKQVIEYESKEDGTLIGNGSIKYPCSGLDCVAKGDWSVPFTMRVDMKDDKMKVTFSNIRLFWPPSYNRTYGAQPGHDAPIDMRGQLEAVKPALLSLGNQLATSIKNNSAQKSW